MPTASWKTPEQEVLSTDFFLVQLTWPALISFHRQSQSWISKSALQSKSVSTLLYNCGNRDKRSILHRITQQTGNHTKTEPNIQNPGLMPSQCPNALLASAAYLGHGGHWQTDRLCAATRCMWFLQNPQVHSLPWKSKVIFVTVKALQGKSDAANWEVLTAFDNTYFLTCPSKLRVTKPQKSNPGLNFSNSMKI